MPHPDDAHDLQAELDAIATEIATEAQVIQAATDSEGELPNASLYARLRLRYEREVVELKERHAARLKRLQNKLDNIDFMYEAMAKYEVEQHLRVTHAKVKYVDTPYGRLGFRKVNENVIVADKEAFIQACGLADGDEYAAALDSKTVITVNAKAVKEIFNSTGEIVAGMEIVPAHESFYVK